MHVQEPRQEALTCSLDHWNAVSEELRVWAWAGPGPGPIPAVPLASVSRAGRRLGAGVSLGGLW